MTERLIAKRKLEIAFPEFQWDREQIRQCLVCGSKENYYSDLCPECTKWAAKFTEKVIIKRIDILFNKDICNICKQPRRLCSC